MSVLPLLALSTALAMQAGYRNGSTSSGLDVLAADGFKPLIGKKIGLITNHTGVDRNGKRGIDLMRAAGVQIAAIFSPEHGFLGREDRSGLTDTTDSETGLKVFSLYGQTLRPTPQMLEGLDALVFDIADVGVRFYTYETTMAYAMEEAAKAGIEYIVLDRPNPVTGSIVEGPLLDPEGVGFTGYMAGTPARHGMTMGELATMFNAEKKLGAKLNVVNMRDWQRTDWFDSTGQPWLNPSPNMRSLKAAILYPGICFLEFPQNFSVGRGTDAPFEQIGADFINGRQLSAYLNSRRIPGIRTYPTRFTPTESRFKGVPIEGVRFEIVDRTQVDSTMLGIELACAIQKLYPSKIDWTMAGARRLIGSADVVSRIARGEDPATIKASFIAEVDSFKRGREKYLLYR